MDVRRLAREERADFAAFLATLTPQQWQAPTLCTAWRVRDVVAHVISYDDLGARALLALAARGRFRLGRINAAALARYDTAARSSCWRCWQITPSPGGCPRRWAAGSGWPRRSSTTRTSAARSHGRAPYRRSGCCPRCALP